MCGVYTHPSGLLTPKYTEEKELRFRWLCRGQWARTRFNKTRKIQIQLRLNWTFDGTEPNTRSNALWAAAVASENGTSTRLSHMRDVCVPSANESVQYTHHDAHILYIVEWNMFAAHMHTLGARNESLCRVRCACGERLHAQTLAQRQQQQKNVRVLCKEAETTTQSRRQNAPPPSSPKKKKRMSARTCALVFLDYIYMLGDTPSFKLRLNRRRRSSRNACVYRNVCRPMPHYVCILLRLYMNSSVASPSSSSSHRSHKHTHTHQHVAYTRICVI